MTQAEGDAMGLSPVQIQALLFAAYTRSDVATVGNFAGAIGTTHVTAVKIINGLVRKGLVSKAQKPEDRRVTLLNLTPEGKVIVSQLNHWGHSLEEALGSIPDEALADFEIGLSAIISAMQQRGQLVVAEPCLGCMHFQPNTGEAVTPHFCGLIQQYLTHEASLQECPEHTPIEV
ncbi:MarR family winged helix-turn-helix transcriptional regulator [Paenibacillus fonticola]|uniref:MarR family winged helix-turn-helix transcriptional regulator n=1 Tax=Paenibacillus fonticola TaxID=379896 RepID=UPI001F0AA8A5|nr:MarR family winged helix-turn-helix transcriptional regulator [Paenibacillus fonticola]